MLSTIQESGSWLLGSKMSLEFGSIMTSQCHFPMGLSEQPFPLCLSVPSFSTLPLSWFCLYRDGFEQIFFSSDAFGLSEGAALLLLGLSWGLPPHSEEKTCGT